MGRSKRRKNLPYKGILFYINAIQLEIYEKEEALIDFSWDYKEPSENGRALGAIWLKDAVWRHKGRKDRLSDVPISVIREDGVQIAGIAGSPG